MEGNLARGYHYGHSAGIQGKEIRRFPSCYELRESSMEKKNGKKENFFVKCTDGYCDAC